MGAKPHLKGGLGAKPHSLGCFCAYIAGCRGISAPFILPTQQGWWECENLSMEHIGERLPMEQGGEQADEATAAGEAAKKARHHRDLRPLEPEKQG